MNMDWAQLITRRPGRFLPPARYRHPSDVIRLKGTSTVMVLERARA